MACAQCRRSDLWSPSNHFAFVLKLRQVLTFEPGPLYPYHTTTQCQVTSCGNHTTTLPHNHTTTQPHSGRSPVVATRFINRSLPAVKSSGVWVQLGKKAIYAIIVLGDNGCFYSASFIGTIPAVIRKLPITSVVCGWGHHSRAPWFTTCHKSRLLTVNSGRSSFLRYVAPIFCLFTQWIATLACVQLNTLSMQNLTKKCKLFLHNILLVLFDILNTK